MASFKSACIDSLQSEGGYSFTGTDYGGETYMGISRRWHPGWPGWAEIDRIKGMRPIRQDEEKLVDLDIVMAFYKKEFWDKINGDKINDQNLANQVFDHAITSGPKDAACMLQVVLGLTLVDGIIGSATWGAIKFHDNIRAARKKYFNERVFYYTSEAQNNPKQQENLASWIRRSVKAYYGDI